MDTTKPNIETSEPGPAEPDPTHREAPYTGIRARRRPSLTQLYLSLPLDKRSKQIRVFDLQPPYNPLDGIRGQLRVVDVDGDDNHPHFVALSYVWGTSSIPPRIVHCNDCPVPVTDNL